MLCTSRFLERVSPCIVSSGFQQTIESLVEEIPILWKILLGKSRLCFAVLWLFLTTATWMTSFSGIQSLEPFSTSHRAGGGGKLSARGCFTCYFFKGSREMDTFLDVQMLGTKPKTLLLERTWWSRTLSDFVRLCLLDPISREAFESKDGPSILIRK